MKILLFLVIALVSWQTAVSQCTSLHPAWNPNLQLFGYVDCEGKTIIEPSYTEAADFSEGLAMVMVGKLPNQRMGFIDETGKMAITPKFGEALPWSNFSEGFAVVRTAHGWGFIDRTGKLKYPVAGTGTEFEEPAMESFSEGVARVMTRKGAKFIDKTGRMTIAIYYTSATSFHKGAALVTIKGMKAIIDKRGNYIVAPRRGGLTLSDDDGIIGIKKGREWSYYEPGAKKLLFKSSTERYFSMGIAYLEKNKKYGFMDTSGKEIVAPIYDGIYRFREDLAVVFIGSKYGVIDRAGNVVIPLSDSQIWYEFHNGLVAFVTGSRPGLMDRTGKVIWQGK